MQESRQALTSAPKIISQTIEATGVVGNGRDAGRLADGD
jgi:hypothetical protein